PTALVGSDAVDLEEALRDVGPGPPAPSPQHAPSDPRIQHRARDAARDGKALCCLRKRIAKRFACGMRGAYRTCAHFRTSAATRGFLCGAAAATRPDASPAYAYLMGRAASGRTAR